MKQERRVFVSHSYPTSSWTSLFLSGLRENGLNPFPNTRQKSESSNVAAEVRKQLEQSPYVVVIVDEVSAASPWVAFEVGAATSLGKTIVAVVDPKLRPATLPDHMKRLHYLPKAGPKATAEQVATAIGRLSSIASQEPGQL